MQNSDLRRVVPHERYRRKFSVSVRRRIAGYLFIFILALTMTVGAGIVMSLAIFLHGGLELIIKFWEGDGTGFESLIKWPVIVIAVPFSIAGGALFWHWAVNKIGLLDPEERREMLGR